jgi:hypothetical protein
MKLQGVIQYHVLLILVMMNLKVLAYKRVKEDEMGRACSMNGEKMNAYRILVGKPEGKRPLGRPRRGWADNVKIDLREIGWGTGSIWLRIGTGGGLL